MARLKMETGNSTAVVVLLVMLAGIIGYTLVRIAGPKGVAASPAPEVAASVQALPTGTGTTGLHPKSNPFKRSDRFSSATALSDSSRPIGPRMPGLPFASRVTPLMPVTGLQVEPMGGGLPPSQPVQGAPRAGQPEPEKPSFVLLATVRSGNRISAVLRIGASDVRTVEVGDRLEGGFVVQDLSTDYAVLRHGREIIIAQKEHAQNEGRQQSESS